MKMIFAVLPCFNEEENIGQLLDKWFAMGKKLELMNYSLRIIGVDDKSTDRTLDILRRAEKNFNNVTVIAHAKNLGLGGVVKTAFNFFIKEGEEDDYCVLMDGDNSHDPEYILPMLEKICECDCVIASRYCMESVVLGVPSYRLILTICAKFYYRVLLHVPGVNDYTCGYRLYKYEIIKKADDIFGEKFITRRSFACMMEVLYKLHLVGCRFIEVPFKLRYDNKKGKSKMKVLHTVKESVFTALEIKFSYDLLPKN